MYILNLSAGSSGSAVTCSFTCFADRVLPDFEEVSSVLGVFHRVKPVTVFQGLSYYVAVRLIELLIDGYLFFDFFYSGFDLL